MNNQRENGRLLKTLISRSSGSTIAAPLSLEDKSPSLIPFHRANMMPLCKIMPMPSNIERLAAASCLVYEQEY